MLVLHWVQVPELSSQRLNAIPPHLVDQLGHFGSNNLLVEAKELVGILSRQTLAKAAHGEASVSVALPAVDGVGLDDDSRRLAAVLQHLALVFDRLGLKEALAGERHDAGANAVLLLEERAGADGKGHLRAHTDEGDVGILLLDEDVGAADDAVAARVLRELIEVLAREGDETRCVLGLEGGDEGTCSLLGVAGTHV